LWFKQIPFELDTVLRVPGLSRITLVPAPDVRERGHLLTFRFPEASAVSARLRARKVISDHRGDNLRIGFGIYHDENDIESLCHHLAQLTSESTA
jgi:selenocysteine lyase/cysteine desulfurase